jgi:hypothetical protein
LRNRGNRGCRQEKDQNRMFHGMLMLQEGLDGSVSGGALCSRLASFSKPRMRSSTGKRAAPLPLYLFTPYCVH